MAQNGLACSSCVALEMSAQIQVSISSESDAN
jgi:hypothetical protein